MDVIYTQYTELFPHHCNTLLLQGSVKTFPLLFSFYALKKISQVHQVYRNYPSSITFSQLWRNSSQLARLFKVKVALSPDLNKAHCFAKIDLSASVKNNKGACRLLQKKVNYMWRIMAWQSAIFLKGVYRFLQRNSSYIYYTLREKRENTFQGYCTFIVFKYVIVCQQRKTGFIMPFTVIHGSRWSFFGMIGFSDCWTFLC